MPIEIYQTDAAIFELHWVGHVTLKDIAEAHMRTAELAEAGKVPHYVHIIVMTELKRFPLDVPGFIAIVYKHSAFEAALLVDCPPAVAIAGNLLQKMLPAKRIEFYPSVDKANRAAGSILFNLSESV